VSRNYLWVLSRTPTVGCALFEDIRTRAARRGYPMAELVMAAPLGGG
jgi:apolipoprotein D and lipocalin family protein